jgi:transposase
MLARSQAATVPATSSSHMEAAPRRPEWTCKSTRHLAIELRRQGFQVSHMSVGSKLHDLGYSLHALRKNREGMDHPERNAQFEHINATAPT